MRMFDFWGAILTGFNALCVVLGFLGGAVPVFVVAVFLIWLISLPFQIMAKKGGDEEE